MKNQIEITKKVADAMIGIGGIPNNETFYREFDMHLRNALGICGLDYEQEIRFPIHANYCYVEFAENKAEELIHRFRVVPVYDKIGLPYGCRRPEAILYAITACNLIRDSIRINDKNHDQLDYWNEVLQVLDKINKEENQ